MKTAYIFHDSFCDPFSEWYPWMKTTLESTGYVVVVPKFPSPAGQSYDSWKAVMKNYIGTFNDETVLIGHGTGGLFAVRLVEESPKKIQGLFLVASYAEAIGNIGFDRINKTFFEKPFDWKKIRSNVSTIRVFAGEDDPFVPAGASEDLAKNLHEIVETIPQGGHLGKAAGFTQLVPIASRISESLSELDKSISIEPEENPATSEMVAALAKFEKKRAPAVVPGTPVTAATPAPATPNPDLKTHTMYEDMSHLVNSNQGRVASSLLTKARTEEAVKEAKSPVSGKNIFYIAMSFIVLVVTIGIAMFLFQKYETAPVIPVTPTVPSLIQAEDHVKITFSNADPAFVLVQKIQAAFAAPMTDSTIRDLYYITPTGRASFPDLLTALGDSDLPVGFAGEFPVSQNEEPVFMHGLYMQNQVASHFLVIKVNDYDASFAMMKAWEPTMLRDLGPLMNISPDFLRTRLTKDVYQDELIQNKNVRTLRYHAPTAITLDDGTSDASSTDTSSTTTSTSTAVNTSNAFVNQASPYKENDVMISYFFLNENTLVITDNLDLIPELLTRWANSQIYEQ